jgi:DNA-binding Xre family transcriptional regulator
MRNININFKLDKNTILSKINYFITNNLEKIINEKNINIDKLIIKTGLTKNEINNILNNNINSIKISHIVLLSYFLDINPDELFNVKIFNTENKKEYTNGFIDGLYYAIRIIKNLDNELNITKLLKIYDNISFSLDKK